MKMQPDDKPIIPAEENTNQPPLNPSKELGAENLSPKD